jgi:hypothetical protein
MSDDSKELVPVTPQPDAQVDIPHTDVAPSEVRRMTVEEARRAFQEMLAVDAGDIASVEDLRTRFGDLPAAMVTMGTHLMDHPEAKHRGYATAALEWNDPDLPENHHAQLTLAYPDHQSRRTRQYAGEDEKRDFRHEATPASVNVAVWEKHTLANPGLHGSTGLVQRFRVSLGLQPISAEETELFGEDFWNKVEVANEGRVYALNNTKAPDATPDDAKFVARGLQRAMSIMSRRDQPPREALASST